MRFGFHLSISGGFHKAIEEGLTIGCESAQIFSRNPRGWASKPVDPDAADRFRQARAESGLAPLVVHLPYLPNFGTPKPDLREKSLQVLKEEMDRSFSLGAEFVVFHPGHAAKDQERAQAVQLVAEAVAECVPVREKGPRLLVETMAGQRGEIGATFEELADIIQLAESLKPGLRLGICLDTAHVWGAGYDVAGRLDDVVRDFDRVVGLDRLGVVHLNDSKTPLGNGVDRHAPPGLGQIGARAMARIIRHDAFKDLAGIMESPKETILDDIETLARVKRWRRS